MEFLTFRPKVSVERKASVDVSQYRGPDKKKFSLVTPGLFIVDAHSTGERQAIVRLDRSDRTVSVDGKTLAAIVLHRKDFQDAARQIGDDKLSYMLVICDSGARRADGELAHDFSAEMRRNGYFGPVLAPTTQIWMSDDGDKWFFGLEAGGDIVSFPEPGLGGTK
jgi:hypothetical protein